MDTHAISRLSRRVLNLLASGSIKTVVDTGDVQKSQVTLNDFETIDGIPRALEFGLASNPPIDSMAVVSFAGGDRSNGVIVGTNHPASRPRSLASGETMLYSQDGKYVYLTASGGIVVEAKGQDVVINDARNVTWNCSGDFTQNVGGKYKVVAGGGVEFDTSLVKSSGDMQDNAGTNSETMATMRTVFNGHDHVVTGVQSGSSQVTSNTPIPTM
jgi:phage baseplate assembly protein V